MSPYNHDKGQVAFFDSDIGSCDLYLAITGKYWFDSINESPFSHWLPKMVHLDLAVDRADFPPVKTTFGKPGHRRLLYIGHSGWTKNPDYLTAIARAMPDVQFSWIGRGRRELAGFAPLGQHDFRSESAKHLVANHDFTITVGKYDANPATILETMAWGLIPVCTPQSGYHDHQGIVNVPVDDRARAVEIIRALQLLPQERLIEMQTANWSALDAHFNWRRFASQVVAAIETASRPNIAPAPLRRRLALRWAMMTGPHSVLRPGHLMRVGPKVLRRLLIGTGP